MTDQQGATCNDPVAMLAILRDSNHDRKLRLFAVACCRRVWGHLTDARSREAVEAVERLIETRTCWPTSRVAGLKGAEAACQRAETARRRAATPDQEARWMVAVNATRAAASLFEEWAWEAARMASVCAANVAGWISVTAGNPKEPAWAPAANLPEKQRQAALLRCIIGNPLHRVPVDPAWLRWNGGVAAQLARILYEERALPSGELDSARLGILADALEDAGCTDSAILSHLRGPGPHVRGCWCVDLLLGRV